MHGLMPVAGGGSPARGLRAWKRPAAGNCRPAGRAPHPPAGQLAAVTHPGPATVSCISAAGPSSSRAAIVSPRKITAQGRGLRPRRCAMAQASPLTARSSAESVGTYRKDGSRAEQPCPRRAPASSQHRSLAVTHAQREREVTCYVTGRGHIPEVLLSSGSQVRSLPGAQVRESKNPACRGDLGWLPAGCGRIRRDIKPCPQARRGLCDRGPAGINGAGHREEPMRHTRVAAELDLDALAG